ncbi:MAG: HAD hydrolase-like protein [Clostridiales bacterium]|nr:HAD hydrolase-like protein [Clostridiales bacterium]
MNLCAIFDMDGTLFDTGAGIKDCVRYALSVLNAPPLSEAQLNTFIGPSLFDSFSRTAKLSAEDATRAVALYREKYAVTGLESAVPYNGVLDMLSMLARKGVLLSIASAKPKVFVDKLLQVYGITDMFACVCAPDFAKTNSDKSALISAAAVSPRSVMVGDTRFDVEGAKKAGFPVIAVLYGYGKKSELQAADYLAESPARVADLLLSFPPER